MPKELKKDTNISQLSKLITLLDQEPVFEWSTFGIEKSIQYKKKISIAIHF